MVTIPEAMRRTSAAKQQLATQEQTLARQRRKFEGATQFTKAQRQQLTRRQRQLIEQARKQNLQLAIQAQKQFQTASVAQRQAIERSSQAIDEAVAAGYRRKLAGKALGGQLVGDFPLLLSRAGDPILEAFAYQKQAAALKGLGGFQTTTGEIQYLKPSGLGGQLEEVVYRIPSPLLFTPSTIAPTTEAMPGVESAGLSARAIELRAKLIAAITPPTAAPMTPLRGGVGSVAYVLPSGERVAIRKIKPLKKPPTFKDISWQETFGKVTPEGKRIDIPGKISLGEYVWGKYSQAVGKVIGYRDAPRVDKPPIFQVSPAARPVIETVGRIVPDVSKWLFFAPAMATTPAALQQLISRGAEPVGETIFVSTVKKVPKGIEIQTGARTKIGGATFMGRTTAKGIQLKKLQLTAGEGWIRPLSKRMDITQIKVAGVVERLGKAREIFVRPTYQITKEAGRGFKGVVGIKEIVRKELYAPKVITTKLAVRTKQPFLGISKRWEEGAEIFKQLEAGAEIFKLRGTARPLFFEGKAIIPKAEIKGILAIGEPAAESLGRITIASGGKQFVKTITPQVQKQITEKAFEQATALAQAATQIVTKEATRGAVVAGVIPTGFGAVRAIIRTPPVVRQIPVTQQYFPTPTTQPQPPIQLITPQEISRERLGQALGLSDAQRLKQRQLLTQETALLQLQPTKIGFKQVQVPALRIRTRQVQPPLQITRQGLGEGLRTPLIPRITFPYGLGARVPRVREKEREGVPAYRIWVKRKGRRIFLAGRYARGEAIMIGAREARQTLRATFGVTEKGRLRVKRRVAPFEPSPEVFRTYRIVKGKRVPLKDVWIQKAPYRLSARGEVREILQAKKRKGGKRNRWL